MHSSVDAILNGYPSLGTPSQLTKLNMLLAAARAVPHQSRAHRSGAPLQALPEHTWHLSGWIRASLQTQAYPLQTINL